MELFFKLKVMDRHVEVAGCETFGTPIDRFWDWQQSYVSISGVIQSIAFRVLLLLFEIVGR